MKNIKKIVFDVDNTLIIWKKEYVSALKETLENFNIDIDVHLVDNVIESLEGNYEMLSKEILLNDINNVCNLNLTMEFIDTFFEKQKKLASFDQEIYNTIEYLSEKYELIVFSNFFTEVQEGRLETLGVRKFFSKIYGGDILKTKPCKESFEKIIGENNPKECVMIGDSLKYDIQGALNAGMQVILYDYKKQYNDTYDYPVIKSIPELKNIL